MMEFSGEELVARINSTREGSVWDVLDIKLVSAEKDKVVATMPIGPNHRQQVGTAARVDRDSGRGRAQDDDSHSFQLFV